MPTQTSIQILGSTQGDMIVIRRTRKQFFEKKCSKWDSNPRPRRCQMWWCYLLSYRGKRSIDYPAQGKPYNIGRCTSHTVSPGVAFQARLLDNQEGGSASTERYAFAKISARCCQRPFFLGAGTTPTEEISSMDDRPRAVWCTQK